MLTACPGGGGQCFKEISGFRSLAACGGEEKNPCAVLSHTPIAKISEGQVQVKLPVSGSHFPPTSSFFR